MISKNSGFDDFLVKAKFYADAVPVLSSLTNAVNFVQKTLIIPHLSEKTLGENHYFKEIKKESLTNLTLKMIPFYSTILFILDAKKIATRRESVINDLAIAIGNQPESLRDIDKPNRLMQINPPLSEDEKREICLRVVEKNGSALQYAPMPYKNDREIVEAAYEQDKSSFQYAGPEVIAKIRKEYEETFVLDNGKYGVHGFQYYQQENARLKEMLSHMGANNFINQYRFHIWYNKRNYKKRNLELEKTVFPPLVENGKNLDVSLLLRSRKIHPIDVFYLEHRSKLETEAQVNLWKGILEKCEKYQSEKKNIPFKKEIELHLRQMVRENPEIFNNPELIGRLKGVFPPSSKKVRDT